MGQHQPPSLSLTQWLLSTRSNRRYNQLKHKSDILDYLKENQDERGIAHWKNLEKNYGLSSYGIGLTKLRKFAKTIGKNPKLASQLWRSKVYEMRIIALLIDDLAKI